MFYRDRSAVEPRPQCSGTATVVQWDRGHSCSVTAIEAAVLLQQKPRLFNDSG